MHGKLFFIGTGAFALGILYGTFSHISPQYLLLSVFLGALCTASSFCGLARSTSSILLSIGLVLFFMPIGEVRAQLAPQALPSAYASLINNPISLTGTIVADPDIREKNQQLMIAVERGGQRTNILVFAPLFQHFAYGEKVLIAGTLTAPAPFATDGGRTFRYDQFLEKKGIFSIVLQADLLEVAPPTGAVSSAANFLFACKHTFVEGLDRALPDPYAELATGLLTGDQHSLSDTLVGVLALCGLIWIVVLSGYHVTLIAEAVLKFFSFLPQRFALILAGVSIVAIIFATGGSAPSLRGGLMAVLTLFARSTGRTYDALRALCAAAVLILLWNPLLLAYDSGFQLSIVVTPALLLCTPILETWLLRVGRIKSVFVREVIAVSMVAQLACVPLILWQTGQLEVWAIPANLLVMSLVPFSMLCAFIAGFIGVLLPLLAPLAGLPAYAVLYYILEIAKTAAKLPFAQTLLPPFPFVFVVLLYGVFILFAYWLWLRNRKAQIPIPLRSKSAFQ
jgi:competence protein ComEC